MTVIIKRRLIIILRVFEGNSTGKCKVCKYRTQAQGKESFDKPHKRNPMFWSVQITDVVFLSKSHRFMYKVVQIWPGLICV